MGQAEGLVRRAPASKPVFLPGIGACLLAVSGLAAAAPVSYQIDPAHTFPSFEADHMGISVWRGKFNTTSGSLVLDKVAGTGTVEVRIDIASVDFGLESMNEQATSAEFFDAARYPQATYRGRLLDFVDGAPTRVAGELTLHGVTRPLELKIVLFKCIPHPMFKRELCGADATATFQRDEFGLVAGKDYGFDMGVQLRIQMEAVQGGLQP
ncbi:MAG: polyisoprenoid-binding protein [Lysobacteraceae bacterium]|nr:MAG: polyisoprenoid-binding protein [Xanthomonadaceae bacterium]